MIAVNEKITFYVKKRMNDDDDDVPSTASISPSALASKEEIV